MAKDTPVTLAVIIGAHGVTGEVRLKVFAEDLSAHRRFNGGALTLKSVRPGNNGAIARFAEVADRCDALSPQLDEQGRLFFDQSLRLQARFLAAASECAAACAEAYLTRADRAAHDSWMQKAKSSAALMSKLLQETDSAGPLKDWYAPEKIFGLQETREMIQRRVSGKVKPRSDP